MKNGVQSADILDYLTNIASYRKLILLNFFAFLLLTYIITLFLPKWYQARVTIMPPRSETPVGALSLLQGFPIVPSTIGFTDKETNYYLAILKSNTIKRDIVKKKDLQSVYGTKYLDEAIRELGKNTDIQLSNEGAISIYVLDKSPKRAAEIANLYAFYLDSIYTEMAIRKAHFTRVFLEEQLQKAKKDLERVENKLKRFQSTYGIIALPEQIKATINSYSELVARKIASEIELQIKKKSLSKTHPDIVMLKSTIDAIENKMKQIESSKRATDSILLPIENLPTLSKKYATLMRDSEIQNKLYGILYEQYEQARIQEAKDTPRVEILDRAVPPRKRAKPKRILTSLVSALSTTLILILFLTMMAHLQIVKATDEMRYKKISTFLHHLLSFKSSK